MPVRRNPCTGWVQCRERWSVTGISLSGILPLAEERQLTRRFYESETGTFNGHYDWVYEEEFGQSQAWNWSKDSRYMAFWQFDESPVPVFQMTNYEGLHSDQISIPIPQVGDPNPAVRIGVIDVSLRP